VFTRNPNIWSQRHPRAALGFSFTVIAGWVAWEAFRVIESRRLVGADAWSQAVLFGVAFGLLALIAFAKLLPALSPRAQIWAALLLMLPYAFTYPRDKPANAFHSVLLVGYDAGLVAFGVVGTMCAFIAKERRRRARRTFPSGTSAPCAGPAKVWRVADEENRGPKFAPYYVARCQCAWIGPTREGADAEHSARRDALSHTPNVIDGVSNPLA
jgi:hypothetical protein